MKLDFWYVDGRVKQESCVELRSKTFMINTYLLILVSFPRFEDPCRDICSLLNIK